MEIFNKLHASLIEFIGGLIESCDWSFIYLKSMSVWKITKFWDLLEILIFFLTFERESQQTIIITLHMPNKT
jgi:hypothetical protein